MGRLALQFPALFEEARKALLTLSENTKEKT
jgi:hypothetical protein